MAGKRILIVEDEAIAAAFLKKILELNGFEVVGVAYRGIAAVELASLHKPEKILMDINLIGNMNGIEAAKKILELYKADIIFMTGYEQKDYIEKANKLGPQAYLIKPVNFPQLKPYLE